MEGPSSPAVLIDKRSTTPTRRISPSRIVQIVSFVSFPAPWFQPPFARLTEQRLSLCVSGRKELLCRVESRDLTACLVGKGQGTLADLIPEAYRTRASNPGPDVRFAVNPAGSVSALKNPTPWRATHSASDSAALLLPRALRTTIHEVGLPRIDGLAASEPSSFQCLDCPSLHSVSCPRIFSESGPNQVPFHLVCHIG
jgi:hypothetical protein